MIERLRAWLAAQTATPQRFGAVLPGKGSITTSTAVTATTTPTLALAFNGNRRTAIFVNTSTTITVSLGPSTIVAGQGVVLAPGGSFDDTDTTAAWFAVAASTTASVAVTELS